MVVKMVFDLDTMMGNLTGIEKDLLKDLLMVLLMDFELELRMGR
jgi:hypothetical protein